MKTRAFLFDMDGVVFLHPPFVEKLYFQIIQVFARFPALITEFISIFTGKVNPKMWEILGQKDEKTIFGIVTDRTLLSLLIILKLHKVPLNSFDFIQTRRSFVNRITLFFLRIPLCFKSSWQTQIWETGLKSDKSFLQKPRTYCFQQGISPQFICVIDNQKHIRRVAKKLGLRTATSLEFIHLD